MKRPLVVDLATWPLRYVTPPELARYLESDPRTIIRMIEAGVLRAHRVGKQWRIPIGEARRSFPVEQTPHHMK